MRVERLCLAAAAAWLAAQVPVPAAAADGVATRLFFGSAIPESKQPCNVLFERVTDELWASFVANVVAEKFPGGFTVVDASGHWKDMESGAAVREDSHMLVLVAVRPDERNIATVIETYLDLFCQDAVLRIDTRVDFDFVTKDEVWPAAAAE